MKKFIFLLATVIIAISISCSNNDNNSTGNGFPTIPQDWYGQWDEIGINSVLQIGLSQEEKDLIYIRIFSFTDPSTAEFKLNNYNIKPDTLEFLWEYDSSINAWIIELHNTDLPPDLNICEDSAITYYLKINNQINQGNLQIPFLPICSFPEFEFNENYSFNWSIQKNPEIQLIWLYIINNNNKEYHQKHWQLEGSIRQHEISKTDYSNYEGWSIQIILNCINYIRSGTFLAFSYTDKDFYQYKNQKGVIKNNNMMHIYNIIEKLSKSF